MLLSWLHISPITVNSSDSDVSNLSSFIDVAFLLMTNAVPDGQVVSAAQGGQVVSMTHYGQAAGVF